MNFKKSTASILLVLLIVLIGGVVFLSGFETEATGNKTNKVSSEQLKTARPLLPKLFNLSVDSFNVYQNKIERNQFLSNILEKHLIDAVAIANLVEKSKKVFNARKIAAGNSYTILSYKNAPQKAAYFIYQPNAIDYIVYDLRDTMNVYAGKKEVVTKVETLASNINNSLYDALQRNGGDPLLAMQLASIYGWAIDFYNISEDDWFKIQYERQYVEDKPVGPGTIKAAVFSHKGKELSAFYFQSDSSSKGEYYDENGNSVKRTFLKAPLKFSRITSKYTRRRLHPVQKIWKAHLGTDYAAPRGTPIIATGNGVVLDSKFSKFNGNYVKIKHNGTYTTQYLHMSKRAVRQGQRVQQGQVIGYVGSTGLATGPHVCYRFWKDGKQVDALKQNFRETVPLEKQYLAIFKKSVQQQQQILASLNVLNEQELTASNQKVDENESAL
jgi:murein DD-endopeptidase MepM/ murein hydrolase activator NlpD